MADQAPGQRRPRRAARMKLLTHNLLQSPGTRHGYPLAIEAEKVETVETEFNPDFLVRMVEKLDYPGLVTTIATVRHRHTLAARPRHALTQRARDTWSHRCSTALPRSRRSSACRSRCRRRCPPTLARTRAS